MNIIKNEIQTNIRKVALTLCLLFLAYSAVHPVIYFITLVIAGGFESLITAGIIMAVLAAVTVAVFTLTYGVYTRSVLVRVEGISLLEKEKARSLNLVPYYGAAMMVAGCSVLPLLAVVVCWSRELILSPEQCLFFSLLGIIEAVIAGVLFFFQVKVVIYTTIYKRRLGISFQPLTLFHKLVIPVGSSIILLLVFASAGIYRLSYSQTYEMYATNIEARIAKNTFFAGSLFEKTTAQLESFTAADEIRGMNSAVMGRFLKKVHEVRGEDVEMFFAADAGGNAPTSLGITRNISDRKYFQDIMKTGEAVFSEPVSNKVTGKLIIVAAIPVKGENGRVLGIVGATVLLDRLESLLEKDRITATGNYMIISKEGKILLHPDRELLGKVIGRDITDDGRKFKNLERFVSSGDRSFFSCVYNGESIFSYKTVIPVIGHYLVFSMNRSDFISRVRLLLIEIITAIILLGAVISFIIFRISRNFSRPIQNTIGIIHSLSDGDLTVDNNDFIADEFGELSHNFRSFQKNFLHFFQDK